MTGDGRRLLQVFVATLLLACAVDQASRDGVCGVTAQQTTAPGRPHVPDEFGASLASVGDHDGDQLPDLLTVGLRGGDMGSSSPRGHAVLFSGKDGRVLRVLAPPALPKERTWESQGSEDGISSVVGVVEGRESPRRAVLIVETSEMGQYSGQVHLVGASDGRYLHMIQRWPPHLQGGNARMVGDVNADGSVDWAVCSREGWSQRSEGVLGIRVHSGATGEYLRTLGADEEATRVHATHAIVDAGDVNGDGVPDIAVGFPNHGSEGVQESGMVTVYSGKDGRAVVSMFGRRRHGNFGYSLCSIGDLDGDRAPDLIVGEPLFPGTKSTGVGKCFAVSSGSGKRLWERAGTGSNDHLGTVIAPLGDVNGDGAGDVAVSGATLDGSGGHALRTVLVLSGRDGSILNTFENEDGPDCRFGESLAAMGVSNDKGVRELAVGAPSDSGRGSVKVYSLRSGRLLRSLHNPEAAGEGRK